MSQKPTTIVGLKYGDFVALNGKDFNLHPARLMPLHKPGDEMALTSIFVSALRMIDEFRKQIFQPLHLPTSGTTRTFTEVDFLLHKKQRVDGLVVVVKGKRIVDALLIEVKNKNTEISAEQIEGYAVIARDYGIPSILTISNQFVSFPTQSPVRVKTPKAVSHYHMSWSYILTVAHILLFDNDTNIADRDQVEVMREVVHYLEAPKSGVVGFTQMKPGWTEVVNKISAGASIKLTDDAVDETVSSWLEEERDMALILSRELGLIVHSGKKRFKSDLNARLEHEKRHLIENKALDSTLRIDGAAGDIDIRPDFARKIIEMSVTLDAPLKKNVRPQITWLRNQFKTCEKKNAELFTELRSELWVDIRVRFGRKAIRMRLSEIDDAHGKVGGLEIKSFSIVQVKHLGRTFESRKRFVDVVEDMLMKYYRGVVQHLKRWERAAPQLPGPAGELPTPARSSSGTDSSSSAPVVGPVDDIAVPGQSDQ